MKINWFPGHMRKAARMIEENLGAADAVIFALDARAPAACLNPAAVEAAGDKPKLYVLNKSDLADGAVTDAWISFFSGQGIAAVKFNASKSGGGRVLTDKLKEAAKGKIEKYKNKGANITVRAMVLGSPNTGKSSIINNLAGRAKAETGNRPGVTRGKQWLKIEEGLEILDTPGVLPTDITNQDAARRLAFAGCIKDEILDTEALAVSLLAELLSYKKAVCDYYKIAGDYAPEELFKQICVKRGFLLKGGAIDTERGAAAVLSDFRKGKFGAISLETPRRSGT